MYSLLAYFQGHQGSHLAAIKSGQAELNPVLLSILLIYNWLFFVPWLFVVWYGHKTVWWYAVGVFVIGWVSRLVWTKIGMVTGLIKNAWAISLVGILIIPALLLCMVELTFLSTETSSLQAVSPVLTAPPCKGGSQACAPWERDRSNTNLPRGTTVTREGVVMRPPSTKP